MSDAAPSQRRIDLVTLAALAAALLVTRLPTLDAAFSEWDGIDFALALEDFDVPHHRPHPPGYPLYIAAAKLIFYLCQDAHAALLALSVIMSLIAVATSYYAVRALFGPAAAAATAALLVSTRLFWRAGTVASSYAADVIAGSTIALLAWRVREGRSNPVWLALALGAFGGVRQMLIPLLLPLCIWAVWRLPRRQLLVPLAAFVGACLAWYIPMCLASGSVAALQQASRNMFVWHVLRIAPVGRLVMDGWPGAVEGSGEAWTILWGATLDGGLFLAAIPAVYALRRQWSPRTALAEPRVQVLLLWLLPFVAAYSLLYIVMLDTYVVGFLVPLLVLAAQGARDFADDLGRLFTPERASRVRRTAFVAVIAVVVVANVGVYLASDLSGQRRKVASRLEAVEYIGRNFDADETVILCRGWAYRYAQYYRRDFQSYWLLLQDTQPYQPPEVAGVYGARHGREQWDQVWSRDPPAPTSIELAPEIRWVVLYGPKQSQMNVAAEQRELPSGRTLSVVARPADAQRIDVERTHLWFRP